MRRMLIEECGGCTGTKCTKAFQLRLTNSPSQCRLSKPFNQHFACPRYRKVHWAVCSSVQCNVFYVQRAVCSIQCSVVCSAVQYTVQCGMQCSRPQRLIIVRALYRARQKAERALGGNKNIFILPTLSSPPPPPLNHNHNYHHNNITTTTISTTTTTLFWASL